MSNLLRLDSCAKHRGRESETVIVKNWEVHQRERAEAEARTNTLLSPNHTLGSEDSVSLIEVKESETELRTLKGLISFK